MISVVLLLAGTCLRLYTEAFFEQSLPAVPPAPLTEANLSRLVLLLKRLDIADMGQCDFLDRPGVVLWGEGGKRGIGASVSPLTASLTSTSSRVADAGTGGPGLPGCPGRRREPL